LDYFTFHFNEVYVFAKYGGLMAWLTNIKLILDFNATPTDSFRGADKSLARPGKKQATVSFRMVLISLRRLALQENKLDDSSRLDVAEIAGVPDLLPSLFPSWSGYGFFSTLVTTFLSSVVLFPVL
jgi:hypothetical protein